MSRYDLKPDVVPVRKKGLFRRGKTQDVVVATAPPRPSVEQLRQQLADAEREENKEEEPLLIEKGCETKAQYSFSVSGEREWVEQMLRKVSE